MLDKITLIIILHNRHKNLDRLLEYYDEYSFPIIIADSSKQKHIFNLKKDNWTYHYTPGLSFTQKIEEVVTLVTTPFVAMCADDDFILPQSLKQCVFFLEQNETYSIAQGWCIKYHKDSIITSQIRFGLLYDFSRSIEENEPINRLLELLKNYRSVLYAVFRTHVLQNSFNGSGKKIKNLFLNEYVTAFLPILYGKYKELPILYQVREFSADSDDKTSVNIDTMLDKSFYDDEMNDFKNFIINKQTEILNINHNEIEKIFSRLLLSFSSQVKINRNQEVSFKKRIGKIVNFIPFFGKKIIQKSRNREAMRQLATVVKTQSDKDELNKISSLLIKYQ